MSSADIQLIKVLETRENYLKYRPHVKGYSLIREAEQFLEDVGVYYDEHPKENMVDWDAFALWIRIKHHPTWDHGQLATYDLMCANLAQITVTDARGVVDRFVDLDTAQQLIVHAEKVLGNGKAAASTGLFEDMSTLLEKWREKKGPAMAADLLAPFDLDDVFRDLKRTDGIPWRLQELNKSIGPLAKGDLVIVAKRPEVGGTSFLCSEVTHMLKYLPNHGKVAFFNNEEARKKVYGRLMMAGLNKTAAELSVSPAKTKEEWKKFLGTREIDVIHDTRLSIRQIERVLRRKKYDLVVFNVLWKIQGSKRDSEIGRLEDMTLWARTIADVHAPVIGIWQADGEAEGMAYPSQNRLYKSKTAVQGEADVLIFIGKTHDPSQEYTRYIGVVKNKLPGGPMTDQRLKHGRFTVTINYGTGRYSGGKP